jgi:hypothetical protein
VGVEACSVRVIGVLTPLHIPVSGFAVHPVVGFCVAPPEFRPADREWSVCSCHAAQVIRRACRRQARGGQMPCAVLDLSGEMVWGTTAMIWGILGVLDRGRPVVMERQTHGTSRNGLERTQNEHGNKVER